MMYQHSESEKHREKMILRGKDRSQILAQCSLGCLNINQKGIYVDDVLKDYRCYVLVASAKSIISINQLIELSQCWLDKLSGGTIGAARDLVNTYDGTVLGTMLDDLAKKIIIYAIQNTVPPFLARLIWPRQNQFSLVLSPRVGR